MMRATVLIALVLSGCATTQTIPATVEVKIPVPVLCQAVEPLEPTWNADLVKAGADVFEEMKALLADRKMSKGYEGELKEALRSCK